MMDGSVELKKEAVKTISVVLRGVLLIVLLAQLGLTAYRWHLVKASEAIKIMENEARYRRNCMESDVIVALNYHEECRKYDMARKKSPGAAAAAKLALEWGLCDAENGGCRGVMGLLIGGVFVFIGIMYLLKKSPEYVQRYAERCDRQHTHDFMYANRGRVNKFH